MTPQEAHNIARERARLLLAFADGAVLQLRDPGSKRFPPIWRDWPVDDAPAMQDPAEWRIKPQPRTFWSILHSNGFDFVSTTDAATALHWHEDGHSVITSVELPRK
jgi:hypothetical protein